jgi:hypothetical protein
LAGCVGFYSRWPIVLPQVIGQHWAIAVGLRLYGSQQGIEYSFGHIGVPRYLIYFFTKEALEDRAHNR